MPSLPKTSGVRHDTSGGLPPRKSASSSALLGTIPVTRPVEAEPTLTSVQSPAIKAPATTPVAKKNKAPVKVPTPVLAGTINAEATAKTEVEKPKKKRNRAFGLTDRDRTLLDTAIRCQALTLAHCALLTQTSEDSIRHRLYKLIEEGYLKRGSSPASNLFLPTTKAADALLYPSRVIPKKELAVSSYRHTLLLATFSIVLELGENVSDATGGMFTNIPLPVVTERQMILAEGYYEDKHRVDHWRRDCDTLLREETYPSLDYGITAPELAMITADFSDDEVDAFLAEIRDYIIASTPYIEGFWKGRPMMAGDPGQVSIAHLATSTNRDLGFTGKGTKSRRPDMVIALPHEETSDGTMRGRCVAVELELSPKTVSEYKSILLHHWHHPLFSGVLWITLTREVNELIRRAMSELVRGPHAPFTMEEAEEYFRFATPMMLNHEKDPTGFRG